MPIVQAVQNQNTLSCVVANYQVPAPEKFSFRAEEWQKWIRRFERFRKATGLDGKDDESQVSTLVYTMGEEADDIFMSFELSDEEAKNYETVRNKFEEKFVVKKNVIFERAKFNSRVQEQNETVDSFITDLYKLSQHCEFKTLKDELIRDRIVVGLRDRRLSEKLQLDPKLTLDLAIRQAKQSEMVKKQQSLLHSDDKTAPANVDSVQKAKPQGPAWSESGKKCSRCGGPQHPKFKCPARESECNKCHKKGHWKKVCRTTSTTQDRRRVHEVADDSDSESFFTGEVIDTINATAGELKAILKVNGKELGFKIDTGADVSVITEKKYKSLKPNQSLKPTKKVLMGPCKYQMTCLGVVKSDVYASSTGKKITEDMYVIKDLERNLLSRKAAMELGLISHVNAVNKDSHRDMIEEKYPKLFHGLGHMKDEYTYKITLEEDAKPFSLSVPRRVPLPLYEETKKELDRMLDSGVVSKVDTPTEWCAPMVVTPKANGKVRVCVDLTALNRYVKRENHPLPSVDTTLAKLSGATVFSKLDANSGFWQTPLAEESRHLTTFITPWGRFRFNVLPYGISSGSEKFQKNMNLILEGMDRVECSIDDVLVHGRNQREHDERLDAVLQRIDKAGMTLNLDKCEFSKLEVKFLGHVISAKGIEADPEKIKAIVNLPPPGSVSEVRTFLGMVNQLSKFAPHLADKTKPIRELLQKNAAWCWDQPQQLAFKEVKETLMESPTLAKYDANKETKVSADASSYGLGAVVLQQQSDQSWRPISFLSRAMTPTEKRYAQIEKEALAITWACERSSDYLVGKAIHIETDHKPLVPILTTHTLDQLSPRIQRMRMRLMRFNFKEVKHTPGEDLCVADALSRLQNKEGAAEPTISNDEMEAHISSVIDSIPVSDTKIQEIRELQDEDIVCKELKRFCLEGWPIKDQLSSMLKPYWSERGELTVVHNLLLRGSRIVIPSAMRLEVLDRIHEGHQGITKCRARAKTAVWWPGLSREIQDLVSNCRVCARNQEIKAEPLMPTTFPDRPWQVVATDLFELPKATYLLVVDYFSRYVEVANVTKSQTSGEIIKKLKEIFARHGIPEQLRSDNGPQYASAEFAQFAKNWGIKHITSSPRFPRSNGEVERAVKTVKSLLKKGDVDDCTRALLSYRSTPLAGGYSPAELLMGRKLRTTLPVMQSVLTPRWPNLEKLQEKEVANRERMKRNHDERHAAQALPTLKPDAQVYVRDMDVEGTVKKVANTPRSYQVQTPKGMLRRNRAHLVELPEGDVKAHPPLQQTPQKQKPVCDQEDTTSSLPSPCLATRPKRVIKPSLKLRESLGLTDT